MRLPCISSMWGGGWRGVGVRKRAWKRFWSICCGCEKGTIIGHLPRKLSWVFAVFALQKIFCEINFRSFMWLRKFFNNENSLIYGIYFSLHWVAVYCTEHMPLTTWSTLSWCRSANEVCSSPIAAASTLRRSRRWEWKLSALAIPIADIVTMGCGQNELAHNIIMLLSYVFFSV